MWPELGFCGTRVRAGPEEGIHPLPQLLICPTSSLPSPSHIFTTWVTKVTSPEIVGVLAAEA